MEPNDRPHGIAAGATLTLKQENQDAYRSIVNPAAGLAAVIVADGLGSHFGAAHASAVVVQSMAEDLTLLSPGATVDMRRLFADAHLRLQVDIEARRQSLPDDLDWDNAFGTTAICAVETAEAITIGYSGNGGIFHIRGNFNTFPPSQLLPWSAINYLNPHSAPAGGKNVLYKLLSPRFGQDEIAPSIITIAKDDSLYGDIVLCCTDGVYSYDQTDIGTDHEQRLWISAEATMPRFYRCLAAFFDGDPSVGALDTTLDMYLAELNQARLVTDDCTVGVLITRQALAFQAQLTAKRNESART